MPGDKTFQQAVEESISKGETNSIVKKDNRDNVVITPKQKPKTEKVSDPSDELYDVIKTNWGLGAEAALSAWASGKAEGLGVKFDVDKYGDFVSEITKDGAITVLGKKLSKKEALEKMRAKVLNSSKKEKTEPLKTNSDKETKSAASEKSYTGSNRNSQE